MLKLIPQATARFAGRAGSKSVQAELLHGCVGRGQCTAKEDVPWTVVGGPARCEQQRPWYGLAADLLLRDSGVT